MYFYFSPTGTLNGKPKPPPPKRTDSLISEEILPPRELTEVNPIIPPPEVDGPPDYSGPLSDMEEQKILDKWNQIGSNNIYAELGNCNSAMHKPQIQTRMCAKIKFLKDGLSV